MRLAFADPPYPGRAHLYADHPDYRGEVAFHELVGRLADYDGWALSTSAASLRWMLAMCPPEARVLAWVKHTIGVSWEPVIVVPARPPQGALRDWLRCEPEMYQWRARPDEYVIGAKPEAFCLWVFAWLGAEADDTLDDLFPGSGAVSSAWKRWRSSPTLPLSRSSAAEGRASRRAAARARDEHPSLIEDAA